LLKGYTGRVEVLDKEVSTWGSAYYDRIGVSFELPNHYQKLTARENLTFFAALYGRPTLDPLQLLAQVGLDDDADTTVAAFSKGMQMRLNLARALLHEPEVLFLDEPTAGLDPVNARRVKELALDLRRRGRTVFLTTHDMHVADELCDRVAFLVDGRIEAMATPRALKLEYGAAAVQVEYRETGRQRSVEYPLTGLGEQPGFLRLLHSGAVETIHTREASLEDVFIRVTGRTLGGDVVVPAAERQAAGA
jgi:fluoroquinolone transport system ATP-binding protein